MLFISCWTFPFIYGLSWLDEAATLRTSIVVAEEFFTASKRSLAEICLHLSVETCCGSRLGSADGVEKEACQIHNQHICRLISIVYCSHSPEMHQDHDMEEHGHSETRQQWILASAILIYSLSFFVVILRRHVLTLFSGWHSCNPLVQTTQYVRGE